MRIKSLAQGENILMLRFEPATFVSKIDILTTTPIVHSDNNLTWKAHINHITTKISKGVGVILRLSKELSYNILILIYNTMPYLTYCCIIWGFTYQTYINKTLLFKKGNAHNYSFSISMSLITTFLKDKQSQYLSNNRILCLYIYVSKTK